MSRATFDTPMIFPSSSVIGEAVTETSIIRPSLVWRIVSKWSTVSPRRILAMIALSSSCRSAGISLVMEVPTISAAVYPKIFSAPRFQLVMMLSRSLPMIASSDDSTMAASWRAARVDGTSRRVSELMSVSSRKSSESCVFAASSVFLGKRCAAIVAGGSAVFPAAVSREPASGENPDTTQHSERGYAAGVSPWTTGGPEWHDRTMTEKWTTRFLFAAMNAVALSAIAFPALPAAAALHALGHEFRPTVEERAPSGLCTDADGVTAVIAHRCPLGQAEDGSCPRPWQLTV